MQYFGNPYSRLQALALGQYTNKAFYGFQSSPYNLIPNRSLSVSVNPISLTESKATGRVTTWLSLWSCTWQTGSCSLGKADPLQKPPLGQT